MDETAGDRSLEGAYLATWYVAYSPDGVECALQIGERSPFDRPCAFITADNPASVALQESENQKRRELLEEVVSQEGYEFWKGEGQGTNEEWPPEMSLLIFEIPFTESVALARRFGQSAFVYAEPRGTISLVWTDEE